MEAKLVHPGDARRQRDEGAHDRKQSADQHGDRTVLFEEGGRAVEVMGAEQHEAAEALDCGTASPGSDPVRDHRAQVAPDSARCPHEIEIEVAEIDLVAGKRHDDLGWQRNTGRLDRHQQRHANIACCTDEGGDEGEEDGEDFL